MHSTASGTASGIASGKASGTASAARKSGEYPRVSRMISNTVCEESSAPRCHLAEIQGSAQVKDDCTENKNGFLQGACSQGGASATDHVADPMQTTAATPVFRRSPAGGARCPALVPSPKPSPMFMIPAGVSSKGTF